MSRIFAIGDIHGCSKTFRKLLLERIVIKKSDTVYCIGDYIDRGDDSKAVIDLIIELRADGYQVHTLRGNHEQMMLDAREDQQNLEHWLINGGGATLKSFGITSLSELPGKYLEFLEQTKFFMQTDKYVFVHAGLNFRIKDPFADKNAMLWTREEHFDKARINNRVLIHGHTPVPLEWLSKQLQSGKVNIDGGCVYKDHFGYGNLVALSLPEMTLITARNIEEDQIT